MKHQTIRVIIHQLQTIWRQEFAVFLEMYLHWVCCMLLSLVLNHHMWEVLTRELPFHSNYIIIYIVLEMSITFKTLYKGLEVQHT